MEGMEYDVIVIGGGPAGLMACISAGQEEARVLLVEKGDRLGRKLSISGGGRCNVTNNQEREEIMRHIPGNGRFLYSSFSLFDNRDIIRFFEGLGVPLKEEDHGRMFPASNRARDVVNALINRVKAVGTDIRLRSPVTQVIYNKNGVGGVRLASGERIDAPCVIIATGGKSVPQTGSTGDGYEWAKAAGHTITELYPTEVPLISHEEWIRNRDLQGLALRQVRLTVFDGRGKKMTEQEGDMIVTHFGLSGPAALRCSQYVVKALKRTKKVLLTINLFPDQSEEELVTNLIAQAEKASRKTCRNILKGIIPERMIPLLCRFAHVPEEMKAAHGSKKQWLQLARLMHAFPVYIHGTRPLEEAFVTGGGVNVKEVAPKTMQSKCMPGLFFCGEILDVHGFTGGYNITIAFSTGFTAGTFAARAAMQRKSGPWNKGVGALQPTDRRDRQTEPT